GTPDDGFSGSGQHREDGPISSLSTLPRFSVIGLPGPTRFGSLDDRSARWGGDGPSLVRWLPAQASSSGRPKGRSQWLVADHTLRQHFHGKRAKPWNVVKSESPQWPLPQHPFVLIPFDGSLHLPRAVWFFAGIPSFPSDVR